MHLPHRAISSYDNFPLRAVRAPRHPATDLSMNRRPWGVAVIAIGFDLFSTIRQFRPKAFALSWRLFLFGVVGPGFLGSAADGNLVIDGTFSARVARHGQVRVLAVQPDGKIVVAGDFAQVDSVPRDGLARLKPDGSLDPTFVPPNDLGWRVSALHVQANGVILLGGSFPSDRTNPFTGDKEFDAFRRLNPDGSLDTRFYPIFRSGPGPSVMALVPDSNGRFVFLHNYEVFGGGVWSVGYTIIRMEEATGESFALAPTDRALVTASRFSDGSLVVAGEFQQVHFTPRNLIAKISANGVVDQVFTPRFAGSFYTRIASVAVTAGNRVLVGGDFTTVNDQPRSGLARLLSNGALDTTFDPTALGSGTINGIWPQPDGKILVAGYFSELGSYRVIRLLSNGSMDSTWVLPKTYGFEFNAVASAGAGYLVGGRLSLNGGGGTALLKTTGVGAVDSTFAARLERPGGVETLEPQPDGKLLIGGAFTSVNGTPRSNLARLNHDGSLDATFAETKVHGRVARILRGPDGKIWLGGEFPGVSMASRRGLARLNADGTLDPAFYAQMAAGSSAADLALTSDGKLLACGLLTPVNSSASLLLRFNANGTTDTTFKPPGLGTIGFGGVRIASIAALPDDRIMISGSFTQVGGLTRHAVARLLTSGQVDPTFDAGPISDRWIIPAAAEQVRLDAAGRAYISGTFDKIGTETRRGVARLLPNGALDPELFDGFDQVVHGALSVNAGGVSVVGESLGQDFLVFRSSGEVWFNGNGYISGGLGATAVTTEGEIILAGAFSTTGAFPAQGLARLVKEPPSPEIVQALVRKVVDVGGPISLQVVARGVEPLSYEWWHNGKHLSGQTAATLNLASAQRNDAGLYRVVVRDGVLREASVEARLLVLPPIHARMAVGPTAGTYWIIAEPDDAEPMSELDFGEFVTEASTDLNTWTLWSPSWLWSAEGTAKSAKMVQPDANVRLFRVRRK